MTRFAEDSAVREQAPGTFVATLGEGWMRTPGRLASGGYLLAIAARAMSRSADDRDPVSITAHYLAPGIVGDVVVETTRVRHGRRHSTIAASIRQDDREIVRLLGAFGRLPHRPDVRRCDRPPPPWPAAEACQPWSEAFARPGAPPAPPIAGRYDMRVPLGIGMWPLPATGTDRSSGGWFRWADGDMQDVFDVLAAADRVPSSVFNLPDVAAAWAPTIELTVSLFARPSRGRLLVQCVPRTVVGDYFEEDGAIWDNDGTLVAVARQLALVGNRT